MKCIEKIDIIKLNGGERMSNYKELVKNIEGMRNIMRDFYIFGFKSSNEFNEKSSRSYYYDRQRLYEWFSEYTNLEIKQRGKNNRISINCREISHNPLYRAFKAKSFTDKDITFHFSIFDILSESSEPMKLKAILKKLDKYVQSNDEDFWDPSIVRKKLKEYEKEGIISIEKKNGETLYSRKRETVTLNIDAMDFFSEVLPCGVIGSFILDKMDRVPCKFTYKHHYINSAIDSQVLFNIFDAISKKSHLIITSINRKDEIKLVPLKIFVGSQNGRQHLIAYNEEINEFCTYRIDHISNVKIGTICDKFFEYKSLLKVNEKYMWGVSVNSEIDNLDIVEFTVFICDDESYIVRRLEREKRDGIVTKIDNNHYKFSIETYNANDLIPWIRTFICRITDIYISNDEIYKRFENDLKKMYEIYNIGDDVF